MRKHIFFISAMALSASVFHGCQESRITYSDAEYVMFADTASVNVVLKDQESFTVPVVSTVACDYDRTFGVEVIDKGSTAVEGLNYRLESNTVTIKAGERSADLIVKPVYDSFNDTDSLCFNLSLVMPSQLAMDLYGDKTKVVMFKSCPYSWDTFTGWCVVTSLFLYDYPGEENKSIQRLIKTTKGPEDNTVVLHDWLFTGYDVTIKLDPSDPYNLAVSMDEDQVISNEQYVFGQINGDDKILGKVSQNNSSVFNNCDSSVTLWLQVYVNNMGTTVGTVGVFQNIMEWVSDEEARRLCNEEGMFVPKYLVPELKNK